MYKLRNGAFQKSGEPIKVLTVPKEIALFFEKTSFNIIKSGTTITYASGTIQTLNKKEVEEYNYEDCRV